MDSYKDIFIFVILVFFSAFFSSSETALLNVNKIKIKHLASEKNKSALLLEKLYENTDKMLGAILIGNNVVNVATSSIATKAATERFSNTGLGIAIGLTTFVILLFGEIMPKNFAIKNSEKISLFIAPIIYVFVKILTPAVIFLNIVSKLFTGLFVKKQITKDDPFITEDELKTIVNVSNKEGVLKEEETSMIQNIFEFKDLTLDNIMTQRPDIIAVENTTSFQEVEKVFIENKFSRLPVYSETIDNIIGILYIKDMFLKNYDEEDFKIEDIMREPIFVNEFVKISDYFKKMQKTKTHIAIVIDEYGGVAGLVTMEDIIESIVGDIYDEYDISQEEIKKVGDNTYIINSSAKLEDILTFTNLDLKSDDYDTLGGFIIDKLGKIPKAGEILQENNITFTILSMDKNRIKKVKMVIN